MTPKIAVFCDGKKFMWDGQVYRSRDDAKTMEESYRREQFQVHITEVEGQFCLYTRRVATQTAPVQ